MPPSRLRADAGGPLFAAVAPPAHRFSPSSLASAASLLVTAHHVSDNVRALRPSQGESEMQSEHWHHSGNNYTITSTVTIRVTPERDYLTSWSILWSCFCLASVLACYQVYRDQMMLRERRQDGNGDSGDSVGATSAGMGKRVSSGGVVGASNLGGGGGSGVAGNTDNAAGSAEGGVSTADLTRSLFRILLLLAMLSRILLTPFQIWSDPLWWQFFGDTLPEMIFASAWTLLVSFFVQLVGIATGSGTNTAPGMVIHATAYAVYGVLLLTQIWNGVASVLLYALLCCIYAALFGVVVYFCPRLITLLQPSFVRHSGLATRLTVCTVLCLSVFLAHTVGYARRVVAPPRRVYWWWNYGALELLPSIVFLLIMHPSSKAGDRGHTLGSSAQVAANASALPHDDSSGSRKSNSSYANAPSMRRTDSDGSRVGSHGSKTPPAPSREKRETMSLLKKSADGGYGSTAGHSND